LERLFGLIGLEDAAQEATQQTGGTFDSMNNFMSIIMIVIGVFIIYSAITGKGPAYKNDYPEEIQEEHRKMLRIFCTIVGPVVLAGGILDYMKIPWGFWVSTGVIVPGIIIYIIIFRRRFKKYLK